MSPHAQRTNELLSELEQLIGLSQRLMVQAQGKVSQAQRILATPRVPRPDRMVDRAA